MVERQFSKLVTRVRFPSSAPLSYLSESGVSLLLCSDLFYQKFIIAAVARKRGKGENESQQHSLRSSRFAAVANYSLCLCSPRCAGLVGRGLIFFVFLIHAVFFPCEVIPDRYFYDITLPINHKFGILLVHNTQNAYDFLVIHIQTLHGFLIHNPDIFLVCISENSGYQRTNGNRYCRVQGHR